MLPGQQKSRTSGLLLLAFLFQIFVFGLWAGGPRIELGERCVFNLRFSAHIGHSINCDSSEFLYAASDLDNIWGVDSKRQSRPGSVLLAWLTARPLVFALDLASGGSSKEIAFRDIERGSEVAFVIERNELVGTYAAFLLQHMAILVLTFMLYMRLAGVEAGAPGRLKNAAALAGLLIFVNNITKQFFWSPHTQLFNILAPVLSVWLFVEMQKTARPERLFLLAGLLCGAGMLFYGIFVLPAVAAGLGYLWRRRSYWPGGLRQAGAVVATGAGAVALFALPYALWYLFIVLKNGAFFNYDVERFRGFVWLGVVWGEQGWQAVLYWLGHNFLAMFRGALAQGWGFVLALAGLVVYARRLAAGGGQHPDAAFLWAGAGIYAVLAAAFYSFYGLTVARLSFTIVPVLFPLIGFYLHYIERHSGRPLLVKGLALAAVCGYVLFMAAKFGPYS